MSYTSAHAGTSTLLFYINWCNAASAAAQVEDLKYMKEPALKLHTKHLEDLMVKHVDFLRMQPKAEVLSATGTGPLENPQPKQARSDCVR